MDKRLIELGYTLNKLGSKVGIGTRLIIIVSLHILIICGNAYIAYMGIDKIGSDSSIVNQSGVIRGGIQKVSKLVTNEIEALNDIKKIDGLFDKFLHQNKQELLDHNMNAFVEQLENLHGEWLVLKKMFGEFSQNRTDLNKNNIVKQSERCWDLANHTVGMAQALSEAKLSMFQIMFIVFFIDFLLVIAIIWLINSAIRKNLEVVSRVDHLTGAYNRNVYNEEIYLEIERCRRYGYTFSLIVLDIDFFKQVNDVYGHDKGDDILKKTADQISKNIRKNDCLCRIGGEEFVIIATETDRDSAKVLAEKLRKSVEEHDFGVDKNITISLGVTSFLIDDTKDSIFKRADEALYASKGSGRNRVTVF